MGVFRHCFIFSLAALMLTVAYPAEGYAGERRARAAAPRSGEARAEGGSREETRAEERRYDEFPMQFSDMGKYDQIAMEPYRDRYDDLPLEEKAELYAKQFAFMQGRAPVFSPEILALIYPDEYAAEPEEEEEADEPEEESGGRRRPDAAGRPAREAGPAPEFYDALPMRFGDMDRYDQIAMEPYRDRYDALPVAEKVRLYGRQFEFMRNRKPNFHPDVLSQVDMYDQALEATNAIEAKKFLYKPPTPKKKRPPKPPEPERSPEEIALEALPGPWEQNRPAPEPEPIVEEPDEDDPGYVVKPDGTLARPDDLRMENLRQGWNAVDVMRGLRGR